MRVSVAIRFDCAPRSLKENGQNYRLCTLQIIRTQSGKELRMSIVAIENQPSVMLRQCSLKPQTFYQFAFRWEQHSKELI